MREVAGPRPLVLRRDSVHDTQQPAPERSASASLDHSIAHSGHKMSMVSTRAGVGMTGTMDLALSPDSA